MLKRSLAIFAAAAMLLTSGCNDTAESSSAALTENIGTEAAATSPDSAEVTESTDAAEEEHVLNILSNSEQLKNLFEACCPDYVYIDEYSGRIGDMQIVWTYCPPNADWDFNGVVKHSIETQDEASAYDKTDIIIADEELLPLYMERGYTMPLEDIGITSEDTAEMYPYTIHAGTYDGRLMGLAWEVTPVVLTYRRDIAKQVLGSDDPETVARYVDDIESLTSTAKLMQESGYHILSTADDLYYAYKSDISPAVIADGEPLLDTDMYLWAEQAKLFADSGYITTHSMWSDEWAIGMTMQGDVFGYLLPPWAVLWTLPGNAGSSYLNPTGETGIGNYAVCAPPSYTYWGGQYICAADGTDDPELVAEFLRILFSREMSTALATGEQKMFVNHMTAIDELAAASEGEEFLGGQNALAVFSECAKLINEPAPTRAGVAIGQYFRGSMRDYIRGRATYSEALAEFRENADRFIKTYQGG
ncbi:MAG: extracellular solute-binding protein [Oscillospiraceae bacterium]|nr:extracellular solute-binding protein [Oscillospiraceae bacterium]